VGGEKSGARQGGPAATPRALAPLLEPGAHPIIAHRGASGQAPENTLPSFELGIAQGADAIECDVHVTADGVPVILHDPGLDRTTDMSGAVVSLSAGRVGEADAGARFSADGGRTFPYRGRGVRVPTLASVLTRFQRVPIVIEIKAVRAREAVRRVVLEHEAAERCILAAADQAGVEAFRTGSWVTGASAAEIAGLRLAPPWRSGPGAVPYRAVFSPEWRYGILVVTRGFVSAARRLGVPVHVWTVDDGRVARRLWGRGVAGLITNYPDRMLQERSAVFGIGAG
jgi:glycerophosphoryl diester phosphodiesterase